MTPVPRSLSRGSILRRLLLLIGFFTLVLLAGAYLLLRASLPDLDGGRSYAGLSTEAVIERDALGVPTIRAANRRDLAWATGYAHAQDRYFQMDLTRRSAAGELAALVGAVALERDRQMRIHRFRTVARAVIAAATPAQRAVVDAYVEGVNAGLASLASRPFEYWLLRATPQPWRAEDTVLVVFAMYEQLNYSGFAREMGRGAVRELLPEPLYRFMYASGTEWDAPLTGAAFASPALPTAEEFDLRTPERRARILQILQMRSASAALEDPAAGSNSWAVDGAHTASGAALLANDMHLGLGVPNVWYRARLQVQAAAESKPEIDVTGVMLAGVPAVVAGSNGQVAWGFTNSYGDWLDLVQLKRDPSDPERYLTPQGAQRFVTVREVIQVHGGADELLDVRTTIWGPVFGRDPQGRELAAVWTAHDPLATNFALFDLETTRAVPAALEVAARIGAPPQNFVAADAAGSIGWTLMGHIPLRFGYDPRIPSDWSIPGTGWQGWLEPSRYPRIVNPPSGRIWSANARVADGEALLLIGDGGYDLGARAGQIRDDLLALGAAAEPDMLTVQLDDRALFLQRWQAKLLTLLDAAAVQDNPARREAQSLLTQWRGRADIDSVAYRLVRAWRDEIRQREFAALTAEVRQRYPDLNLRPPTQFEGPLWQMITAEPVQLLDPRFASWREFELAALDQVIRKLHEDCKSLDRCTWGQRNRVQIRHPLSRALPLLAGFLDMPALELPGDDNMPRVQGVSFGASERFAVSPGREAQGYFQMPGGQSGHPLSPFYRAGYDAWVEGRPLPFLPGPVLHRLELHPLYRGL